MIVVGKVIIIELIEYCIKILIIYIRNGKIMENKERKIYRILKTKEVTWERILFDEKFKFYNKPFTPAKLSFMGRNMKPFIITKKYANFNGRLTTEESILFNEEFHNIIAQWDCGATTSVISSQLAEKLGLTPCGKSELKGTTSAIVSCEYNIELVLSSGASFELKVNSSDEISGSGIDMLIGMDVIQYGDFAVSTYNGETCFSFRIPSMGLIDFSKDEKQQANIRLEL